MAEGTEQKTDKKSALDVFREKLSDRKNIEATVLEGLKSTNAKVRSLAVKAAFKLKDHKIVKQHVLPLINSDKSKKVLRTVSGKVTRKDLIERVKKMAAAKKAPAKAEAAEGAEATPAAGGPAAEKAAPAEKA